MMQDSYFEMMRAHIDEGGKLSHRNGIDLLAEVERLRKDAARLDFLDRCNARLNAYSGTVYRWTLILNHNVNRLMCGSLHVDLNDQEAKGLPSCRHAIDAEMARIERDRAA